MISDDPNAENFQDTLAQITDIADCQLAEVAIERESLEKVPSDNKEKFVTEHLLIGTAKIAAGIDF